MEPTLQVPLIGGLAVLLVLLLVVRSSSVRRARRTPDAAGVAGPVVTLFRTEDEAPVQAFDETGADEAAAEHATTDERHGDPEGSQPAVPARRGFFGRRGPRPQSAAAVGVDEETAPPEEPVVDGPTEVAVAVGEVGVVEVPAGEAAVDPELGRSLDRGHESVTESEVPEQAVAERRGLFRRRRAAVAEPATDLTGEPVGELAPELAAELAAGLAPGLAAGLAAGLAPDAQEDQASDQAEIRALREQLRALELVVQQQAADHPTAALAKVEEVAAEQSAAYLRQVSLVVSGLAAHTDEEENPRRTLARVAAAVERLGVPNSMERPILPVSHELSSRSSDHGTRQPSHLQSPGELGAATAGAGPADVFARLDATAPQAPLQAPAQVPLAAPPAAPLAGPLAAPPPAAPPPAAPAEVHEPLFPPASQPYPAPTTSVHDLGALAAFDGPQESYDAMLGDIAGGPDAGIPAYEEPPAVLPVPAPAAPEPTGRRRGRRPR